MDPLNKSYNCAIMFNKAVAHSKLGNLSEALADLDAALVINEDYLKAITKRAEIFMLQ